MNLKKNSLTKKLFLISLGLLVFSIIGGFKYGFITEFPFTSVFTIKFSTFFQISIIGTYCFGFLLAEGKIKGMNQEKQKVALVLFFVLFSLALFEVFFNFHSWFSVYERRSFKESKMDEVRSVDTHAASKGLMNTSIPKKILFPFPGQKPPTYNILAKKNVAYATIFLFSILRLHQIILKEGKYK